ncbi:NADPH-dependent FMN reductase [Brevibacillus sp. H7]|uniref:NADPH-dependent FMN reductase n=1 Tax=Brevibacillus sp. H7 TaxID=3349138 RepID=UPI003824E9BA
MNLLLINGGARKISRTRGLTQAFDAALKAKGVSTRFIDLGVDLLPIFTGSESDKAQPVVQKLINLAQQADGFVICTPDYHNGMSGALKNALDFLGGAQFRGKPAVIGAACGGGKGGINALNNLRIVLRGVYANVLPDQIVADPEHFNEYMELVHPDAKARVEHMTQELIRFVKLNQLVNQDNRN